MNINKLFRSSLFFILLLNANIATAQDAKHQGLIDACKQVIYDYAFTRDRFDAEGYAATFSEDGELLLMGQVIKGRKALAERINRQRGHTFDKHMITSLEIIPIDDKHATGTVYTIIFEAHGDSAATLPVKKYNMLIVEYRDNYQLTGEGCKFTKREVILNFTQEVDQTTGG